MNQIKLTSIAIQLQKSLGHSAGGIDIQEVPRLLQEAPLEVIEKARNEHVMLYKKHEKLALEASADPSYGIELRDARDAACEAAYKAGRRVDDLSRPWWLACGSPEWAGICTPCLQYSTPKGSVNWDLTGAKPRVWIERSKPGQAGQGLPGDEVVTYDVLTGRLHWTERAEARHLSEMAGLLYEVDPEARAIVRAEADRRLVAETKSAFRMAQLAIPVNDPEWDRKWNLLELGMAALDRAAASGTFYGPGMIEYFTSWEKAQVFLAA